MKTLSIVVLAALLAAPAPASAEEGPMRDVRVDSYTVRLDLARQVIRVAVPDDRDWGNRRGQVEAPILPTLAGSDGKMMSAAVLAAKAKAFDDGLYAAAELAAEPGKLALLTSLGNALARAGESPALEVLYAAAKLGGLDPTVSKTMVDLYITRMDRFTKDPLRSKPIGFYTWSEELGRVFRQDRMLQTELTGKSGIEAIVRALAADGKARETYGRALVLAERLTNPLAGDDLRPLVAACLAGALEAPERGVAFFPPSRAPETELVKKLYGARPIPEGFDLAEEMVKRIREGVLSLAPTERDGWYAHQLFSLAPLVVPERTAEAKRLVLDEEYRRMLVALFKGLLTLTRETHVKQLDIPSPGAAPPRVVLEIRPGLRAEPLATHYVRRAQAYEFVRGVLTEAFGAEGLAALRRQTPAGAVGQSLGAEIERMASIYRGASAAVMRDLGGAPLRAEGAAADEAAFTEFAAGYAQDPDVGGDLRCMVPVFFDVERKQTKVWVFLGWAERPVVVSYATPPRVAGIFGADGAPAAGGPEVEFEADYAKVLYPVTAEVYVTKILDRGEFRRLCDRWKTSKAILAHLE